MHRSFVVDWPAVAGNPALPHGRESYTSSAGQRGHEKGSAGRGTSGLPEQKSESGNNYVIQPSPSTHASTPLLTPTLALPRIPPPASAMASSSRLCAPRAFYVSSGIAPAPDDLARFVYCSRCRNHAPTPSGAPPQHSRYWDRLKLDSPEFRCRSCTVIVFIYIWRCWACGGGNLMWEDHCTGNDDQPDCGYRRDSACVVSKFALKEVGSREERDYEDLWGEEL